MNKASQIILFYVLIIAFIMSPVLAIPFTSSEYMQVGWALMFFTVPIGVILLVVYTGYLVYKKLRSQN